MMKNESKFDSVNNSGVCLMITVKPVRFGLCHTFTELVWLIDCSISYFQSFAFSVLGKIY